MVHVNTADTLVSVSVAHGREKAMEIVVNPSDIRARINSTVTLQCQVRKFPNMKLYWMHNGFGIDSQTVKDYGKQRYSFPGPLKDGESLLHVV